MPPTVTGVIPVHQHQHWLPDAMRSLASQDYRPLRMVVVDDGSTDDSFGAACSLLSRRERLEHPDAQLEPAVRGYMDDVFVLVLRRAQARGPSAARNYGAGALDGTDYLAFLDSDDMYEQGKVSKSVDVMERLPEVGVVYSDYDTLRPDGLRLRQYKEPYSRERLLRECLVNCDSLIRKRTFDEVGGFDECLRVCEDYDLWLRLTERQLAWHIPESLVTIRVGTHSSTSTVRSELWQANYRRVFEKLRERGG